MERQRASDHREIKTFGAKEVDLAQDSSVGGSQSRSEQRDRADHHERPEPRLHPRGAVRQPTTSTACLSHLDLGTHTETVTRMNVAGIEHVPLRLVFCAVKSATSSFARSSALPLCSA